MHPSHVPWLSRIPPRHFHHDLSASFPVFHHLFVHSVTSNSLRAHGLQHARLPCPSPSLVACWNSCPSSQWCHPTISSSVFPLAFNLSQHKGLFQSMSQFFASGGQSIGVSASTSVLPTNTQDWSPLGWTGSISLQSKDSQESSPTPQFKSINSLVLSLFLWSNSHICTWLLEKT